jgi:hypothetical protein
MSVLPRPVLRERAGVRVISNVESQSSLEITLTLTLSRRTGRGDRNPSYPPGGNRETIE